MGNYQEELQKEYDKLSPKLKEVLSSPEVSTKVVEIGERFKVAEDKTGDLATLAAMVLMRILPLSALAEGLKTILEVEEGVSQRMAHDLNSEIFSKYKDEFEKISGPEETPRKKEIGKEEISKSETPSEEKKIEIKEELLQKKGPDQYKEPIEGAEEAEKARVVKEGGRIKKVF